MSSLRHGTLNFFFAYLFFSCTFLFGNLNNSDPLQQKINSIALEERIQLGRFFSHLIRFEGLGFVLFKEKPVCLSGYFKVQPIGNFLMGYDTNAIKFGWKVWKKYEHLFPHSNFLLFEEKANLHSEIQTIFLINKKTFLETVRMHEYYFHQQLDNYVNAETLLAQIIEANSLLGPINMHEGLLGILLGYGPESAMLYHKRDLYCFSPEEIELEALVPPLSLVTDFIRPIYFVGKSDSLETRQILEKNLSDLKELYQIFSSGKFMELALEKMVIDG